jgi:hypothetical protein
LQYQTWTQTADITSAVAQELKVNYKNKSFGSVEAKASTSKVASTKVKLDQLQPGLVVELSAEDGSDSVQSVNTTYRKDFFAGNVKAEVKNGSKKVYAAGAVGFDGVSVGASVEADVTGAAALSDYNGGFQYEQKDLTVSVVTSKKADVVTLSVNQVVNSDVTVGAQGVYSFTDDSKKSLQVGASVSLDNQTSVNAKLNQAGVLSTAFTHQLRSYAKVGLNSVVGVTGSSVKPEFAVILTLGETSE